MKLSRPLFRFTISTVALLGVACAGGEGSTPDPVDSAAPPGASVPAPTDSGAIVGPGDMPTTGVVPTPTVGGVPGAVTSDPGAALPPGSGTAAPPVATAPVAADPGMPVAGVAGAPGVDMPVEVPEDVEPEVASDVQFSVPSGTFQGELSVTITAAAGAEIRFTTDGSPATDASTLYDGAPLLLTETTQLRAVSFTGGVAGFPNTAIYVARTFDVESDIPIVIMEGYAGGRPQKETAGFGAGGDQEVPPPQELIDLGFMVFEPVNGVARISDVPVLATRAGYRERGQSSANAEKSPYKVEFWDENNADIDKPVLGMPAESDWAMIGEAFDATQIQNSLVYDWGAKMGLATVRLRFVELYINFDGGPLEATDYFGLYALTETIKNQKDRINLKQLDETDTVMPDITGGYIFKFDQAALDGGETELVCTGSEPLARGGDETATCWNDLGMVDPEVLNPEQLAYLEPHVQAFHDALHQSPIGDYSAFIDLPSFVDHVIINELTRDVDAYVRSSYFHKDREALIKAGPLWDYNLAMASFNAGIEGWHYDSQLTGRGNDDWFHILGNDPAFRALFDARWTELRGSFLSDEQMLARIEELAAPIANAALRNQERWGEMATEEEGNQQGGGNFGGFGGAIGDWETALADLAAYLPERAAWIDMAVAEGYTMADGVNASSGGDFD